MTISATVVRNPRRARFCAACALLTAGPQVRMYGAGEHGDRPYEMRICIPCAEAARHVDKKIDRALKQYATNQEQTK